MTAKTCNYASCMEDVGDNGVVVSLKRRTFDGEARAIFCCAGHAAASLLKLAADRMEARFELPTVWRQT